MRSLKNRINELERQMGIGVKQKAPIQMVWGRFALDNDRCVEILTEYGFFHDGVSNVVLSDVPLGLSDAELKRYLREHGHEICDPPPQHDYRIHQR